MNLRTGIMALTMAATGIAGHAQQTAKTMTKNDSIAHVVQKAVSHKVDSASTIAFADAQKMMGATKKAPKGMVTVTNQKGKFIGRVTPQGLNGHLEYSTSSKMIRDPRLKPETKVTYGAGYVHSDYVKNAGTLAATVEKGKTNVDAQMFLGKTRDDVIGGLKLKAGYNYPLGNGFTAGPEVGLHTRLEKVNNDAKGAFAPEISAVGKYKHEFDNGVRVGAEAAVGGAAKLGYNNRATHVGSIVETYRANASVGYKDVEFVAGGGKDVHLGKHATAGIRYTF